MADINEKKNSLDEIKETVKKNFDRDWAAQKVIDNSEFEKIKANYKQTTTRLQNKANQPIVFEPLPGTAIVEPQEPSYGIYEKRRDKSNNIIGITIIKEDGQLENIELNSTEDKMKFIERIQNVIIRDGLLFFCFELLNIKFTIPTTSIEKIQVANGKLKLILRGIRFNDEDDNQPEDFGDTIDEDNGPGYGVHQFKHTGGKLSGNFFDEPISADLHSGNEPISDSEIEAIIKPFIWGGSATIGVPQF